MLKGLKTIRIKLPTTQSQSNTITYLARLILITSVRKIPTSNMQNKSRAIPTNVIAKGSIIPIKFAMGSAKKIAVIPFSAL